MSNGKNEKILDSEAQYQDLKVEGKRRVGMGKFYSDASFKELKASFNESVGEMKGLQVLDYGCGMGATTIDALKKGAFVTAIDISSKSIEYVQKAAAAAGVDDQLNAVVMDAQQMTFADESFDLVIGSGILHHLPELEQALSEIKRVLKPGGRAVFSEPLGMNPLLILFRWLTPHLRTKDEQPFRMKELEAIERAFPHTSFAYFECFTLLTKPFIALKMEKIAQFLQKALHKIDKRVLAKGGGSVSLFQKWSWCTVFVMTKR